MEEVVFHHMYVLAIYEDEQKCKIGILSQSKGRIEALFFQEYEMIELFWKDVRENQIDVLNQEFFSRVMIISSFSAEKIFLRHLSLPFTNKRKIKQALPFQIEGVFPLREKNTCVVPHMHIRQKETDIVLYAYSSSVLQDHLQKIMDGEGRFVSDQVSSVPTALFRIKELFFPKQDIIVCLYVEEKKSSLVFMGENFPQYHIVIPLGHRHINESFRDDEGHHLEESPAIFHKKAWEKEVKSFLECIEKKGKILKREILVLGHSSFDVTFLYSLGWKIMFLPENNSKILQLDPDIFHLFIIPIGLAIDSFKGKKKGSHSLQLCVKEFPSSAKWKNLRYKVRQSLCTSIFCTACVISSVFCTLVVKASFLQSQYKKIFFPWSEISFYSPSTRDMLFSPKETRKKMCRWFEENSLHKDYSSQSFANCHLIRNSLSIILEVALEQSVQLSDFFYNGEGDNLEKGSLHVSFWAVDRENAENFVHQLEKKFYGKSIKKQSFQEIKKTKYEVIFYVS